MNQLTPDGHPIVNVPDITLDAIRRWVAAGENLHRLRTSLNAAVCELGKATNALGNHALPKEAKTGEFYRLMVLDGVLILCRETPHDVAVEWEIPPGLPETRDIVGLP